MSVIGTLITDRTAADVARVMELGSRWVVLADRSVQWTGTESELEEWLSGLKGSYNASDLNRVQVAVEYIAGRLRGYGYAVTLKTGPEWVSSGIPNETHMEAYLSNVSALRAALAVAETTPQVPPDMDKLTWQEANDIEQILVDIDRLLHGMAAAFRHSNAAVCGGSGLLFR